MTEPINKYVYLAFFMKEVGRKAKQNRKENQTVDKAIDEIAGRDGKTGPIMRFDIDEDNGWAVELRPGDSDDALKHTNNNSTVVILGHSDETGLQKGLGGGNVYGILRKHGLEATCHINITTCNAGGRREIMARQTRGDASKYAATYQFEGFKDEKDQESHAKHNLTHRKPPRNEATHESWARDLAAISAAENQPLSVTARTGYVSSNKKGEKQVSLHAGSILSSFIDILRGVEKVHKGEKTKVRYEGRVTSEGAEHPNVEVSAKFRDYKGGKGAYTE